MISIVILTKNEEANLPLCLKSLAWCDDVHILDSGSTDKTIEIAQQHKAKTYNNIFESFGQQRNFALDYISIKYEWISFLDADEVVTEQFRNAMLAVTAKATDNVAGFYCCWKTILEEKWLKYCDNFPKWQFRLMRKNRARFTDFGHGQKENEVIGDINYIAEPYLHYGFSRGWAQWIERHNLYSSQEAIARYYYRPPFKQIFAPHASTRNPALKSWLSRIPGWPLLRFFQIYFLNFGFLEGMQGIIYSVNISYYEFLIQIKMRDIKARDSRDAALSLPTRLTIG